MRVRPVLAVIAAGLLAYGCAFVSSGVYSGWSSTPTAPDREFLAVAERDCLPKGDWFVLQDQRGDPGSAFLASRLNEQDALCVVIRVGSKLIPVYFDSSLPQASAADALEVTWLTISNPSSVAGTVPVAASLVEVTTQSGMHIVATIGGGRFLAWWPGEDDVSRIEATDANGEIVSTWWPKA